MPVSASPCIQYNTEKKNVKEVITAMSGIGIARGRHIAYDSGAAGAQPPSLWRHAFAPPKIVTVLSFH